MAMSYRDFLTHGELSPRHRGMRAYVGKEGKNAQGLRARDAVYPPRVSFASTARDVRDDLISVYY